MAETPVLTIVSGGMGRRDLLTGQARVALEGARRIYTTDRLGEQLLGDVPSVKVLPIQAIVDELEREPSDAAVVVSGDCGFYSLSSMLRRRLEGIYRIAALSGISSLQYLCAARGIAWQDVEVVSLHGREQGFLGAVSYHAKSFFLCGGQNGAGGVLAGLHRCGPRDLTVTVGENLSAPAERIVSGPPGELLHMDFAELAVVLVENPSPANPAARLRDRDFVRGKSPMTKEAVRTLVVSMLDIRPGDTVWDLGAGTGSVSVALAYAARGGMVYAVERNSDAVALIRQNRVALGAYNMAVVEGEALASLPELPPPSKVFIGGSGGTLPGIFQALRALPAPIGICITAVTLESLTAAFRLLHELDPDGVEVVCVNAAAAAPLGGYHLMKAENPVYILCGRRRG